MDEQVPEGIESYPEAPQFMFNGSGPGKLLVNAC
jgi:hypothetical protein